MINPINSNEIKPEDLTLKDIWEIHDYLNDEGAEWLEDECLKHGTVRIERAMDELQKAAMEMLEAAKISEPEAYAVLMEMLAEKK